MSICLSVSVHLGVEGLSHWGGQLLKHLEGVQPPGAQRGILPVLSAQHTQSLMGKAVAALGVVLPPALLVHLPPLLHRALLDPLNEVLHGGLEGLQNATHTCV